MSYIPTNVREFRICYGFTRDPEFLGQGPLEFRGILKVSPGCVGIYRTGALFNVLRTILSGMQAEYLPGGAYPTEVSTSVGSDGTPEHIIDPAALTVLYDARRRVFVLKVPGRTHYVVKLRGAFFGRFRGRERELLQCLEEVTGSPAVPVRFRWKFWSLRTAIAFAVLALLAILAFLVSVWLE